MNLRNLHIITVTHQNLAVDELKNFMIADSENLSESLRRMKDAFDMSEVMYLSTCNRVSYIFTSPTVYSGDWLARFMKIVNPNLSIEILSRLPKYIDHYLGKEAIIHLSKVASSIDSLVVGEREIFRQFRKAYHDAEKMGYVGDFLRLVEQHVVSVAKKIYTNTRIGDRPVSVASLSFQRILESGLTPQSRILMIGAGEINRNLAKFLHKHDFRNVVVFNRSLHNTGEITELFDTDAFHLSDLQEYNGGFDGIIICTASAKPILNVQNYKHLLGRDTREKVIVDLAVPRNVEEEIVENFPVNYLDIEGIRKLAEENLAFRKNEMTLATQIVIDEADTFDNAIQLRNMEKALRAVPMEVKEIKEHALTKVFNKRLQKVEPQHLQLIEEMMDYMEKKCIAIPMKVAKQSLIDD